MPSAGDVLPAFQANLATNAQSTERKLILANPMQQLDAGNRDRCMSVVLQSQHRPQTPFHSAVILLDDIVEILARADRDNPQSSIFGPKLANGPMRGLVSVTLAWKGETSVLDLEIKVLLHLKTIDD